MNQPQTDRTCPSCGSSAPEPAVAAAGYRCLRCGMELAHLDISPAGAARGVLGWLHGPGDLVLDRFQITQLLGKGGFAATYLVEDLALNRKQRALKEVPEVLYDEAETAMLAQLRHPAIPGIIDRVRHRGMVYMVLEFGGGRTLETERQHRGGRIPPEVLLPWLWQLGQALVYLHGQSPPIIHRDLKPDNVLLDEQDRVMLIDFGIAKQAADSGQTRTLARAATSGYSPPEQALGSGTDVRSDVYSLAATAYVLLTGQIPPPAHRRVAGAALQPPVDLVPELPVALSDALVQALNLNTNLRPASVDRFLRLAGIAPALPEIGSAPAPTWPLEPPPDRVAQVDTLPIDRDRPIPSHAAPVAASDAIEHTLRVGDLPPDRARQASSGRIHSERVTLVPTGIPRQRGRPGVWAGLAVALLLVGGGSWWLWEQTRTPDPKPNLSTAPHRGADSHLPATPTAPIPAAEPAPPGPPVISATAHPGPAPGAGSDTPAGTPPAPAAQTDAPASRPLAAAESDAPATQPTAPLAGTDTPAPQPDPRGSDARSHPRAAADPRLAAPPAAAEKASALDALNQAKAQEAVSPRPAPNGAVSTPARTATAPAEPRRTPVRNEPAPRPSSQRCIDLQTRAALGEPVSSTDLQQECRR